MKATPEQRVAGRLRALVLSGVTGDEARRRAHEIEDVPMPAPAASPAPTAPFAAASDVEELHWKLSCESRRADASTRRAAKLLRENRLLRQVLVAVEREAARYAQRLEIARVPADFLEASKRRQQALDDELRAMRQRVPVDR